MGGTDKKTANTLTLAPQCERTTRRRQLVQPRFASSHAAVGFWPRRCQPAAGQTIGGIVCPSGSGNVVPVPVGSDLSDAQYSAPDNTYQLGTGKYFSNSAVTLASGATCYIGSGATEVQLGEQFRAEGSAQLAFRGLTLNGQPGGILEVADTASLAADSVVMRDFPGATIKGSDDTVSITLDDVKVSGSGLAAVHLRAGVLTWSNVSEQTAQQRLLSLTKGGKCRMPLQ